MQKIALKLRQITERMLVFESFTFSTAMKQKAKEFIATLSGIKNAVGGKEKAI